MPALSPALFNEIVQLCSPHFRLQDDRDALLLIPLSTWEGFADIIWTGSERAFTTRLLYQLPGSQLQAVLQHLLVGYQAEEKIHSLIDQIDADLKASEIASGEPAVRYYQRAVKQLSGPRYQLDDRFVQLTLLLDQGVDALGPRFVAEGDREKYHSLGTLLSEAGENAFVLLGKPGSGKTTLLRRLQLERAWSALDSPGRSAAGPIPFFVTLNAYRSGRPGQPPPAPPEWLAEAWELRHREMPTFHSLFSRGKFLFLLDGLNEMPHLDKADYRERVGWWQQFVEQSVRSGNTIVFSCRNLDYSAPLSAEAIPVRQVQVEPLHPPQIEQFLRLHLPERADQVWQALYSEPRQLQLFNTPFFLRLLVEQVDDDGRIPAGQADLLTSFIRRALRREVHRRQRLFQPDALISEDDFQQIQQNVWFGDHDLPPDGPLFSSLANLAFAMQDHQQAEENYQVRVGDQRAFKLIDHPQAAEIVAAGIQLNLLDKDLATREIYFYHQLLQEYFAARVLAGAPEPGRMAVPWEMDQIVPSLADTLAGLEVSDPLPAAPATRWQETALLAAAMTTDQTGFVAGLAESNLPLAARCAASPDVHVSDRAVTDIQRALLRRIASPQADLRARIVAAEALGELGDPRFVSRQGTYGSYLEPPVAAVSAGSYPMGSDDSPRENERPAHRVELAAFEIGVFPVTYAEYRLFIEAGGYEQPRWWQTEAARSWLSGEAVTEGRRQGRRDLRLYFQGFSEDEIKNRQESPELIEEWLWYKKSSDEEFEAWLEEQIPAGEIYRRPGFWEDSQYNHSSRPLVGVTWFEARAYCAWLSAQTGAHYDLPTEAEWEAAARGREGREYAYGEVFDAANCNTFETHVRGTTPVGVFPGGITPEGVHDLSGNVWEWTSTSWGRDIRMAEFGYPYDAQDGREDPENGKARRILRGGSWINIQSMARAAYRDDNHPSFRNDYYGFRVVRRR